MEKNIINTAYDKEAVIRNATKAALKDGYDYYVIGSVDGTFSFCRAGYGKPVTPLMPGEILFGKVEVYRVNSIPNTRYHDYSQSSLRSFFSSLEAGRTYPGAELLHLFNTWAAEQHYQPWTLSSLYNALTSDTSISKGFMQEHIVGGKRRFSISPEMKTFLSGIMPVPNKTPEPIESEPKKEDAPTMKPYRIAITETYVKEVEIYAEDSLQAEQMAHDLCSEGVIEFDAENFTERSTECRGIARPSDLRLHEVYGQSPDTYTIYQLKNTEDLHYHHFASLKTLHAEGNRVDAKNYDKVYSGPLPAADSVESTLNHLYMKFNTDHPSDFRGHSLSMSDIIVIESEGKSSAHYVDTFGFKEVPEFFAPAPEKDKPSLDGQIKTADARKSASISDPSSEKDMGR